MAGKAEVATAANAAVAQCSVSSYICSENPEFGFKGIFWDDITSSSSFLFQKRDCLTL